MNGLLLLAAMAAQEVAAPVSVYVLPIHGEIDISQASFVRRCVEEILAKPPSLVVLDVDTPGGKADEMMRIVTFLTRLSEAKIRMATYVSQEAEMGASYSAGALISMTSPAPLFMHERSVIGAAEVILVGPEGVQSAGEKINSAYRAKFAAVAKSSGYNPDLAVAMVDKQVVLHKVTIDGRLDAIRPERMGELRREGRDVQVVVDQWDKDDKILTLDARTAAELGVAKLAADRKEVYRLLGLGEVRETVPAWNWSERLVGIVTSGSVSVILLIVGLVGIWIEMKAPGFGAPGLVGATALLLFFFGHYLAGLAQFTEIILVFAGLGLLAVEIFVFPGTFVCAGAGVICIMSGLIMAMQDFVIPDFVGAPWQVDTLTGSLLRMLLGFSSALVVFAIIASRLKSVPGIRRLALGTTLAADRGFTAPGPEEAALVGRRGTAASDLRPSGRVEIDGRIYDVVTDGAFISKGAAVVVLSVEGNRIMVGAA